MGSTVEGDVETMQVRCWVGDYDHALSLRQKIRLPREEKRIYGQVGSGGGQTVVEARDRTVLRFGRINKPFTSALGCLDCLKDRILL